MSNDEDAMLGRIMIRNASSLLVAFLWFLSAIYTSCRILTLACLDDQLFEASYL